MTVSFQQGKNFGMTQSDSMEQSRRATRMSSSAIAFSGATGARGSPQIGSTRRLT
jgi:hypothetical protein